jgi:hypothetical protein
MPSTMGINTTWPAQRAAITASAGMMRQLRRARAATGGPASTVGKGAACIRFKARLEND